MFTQILSTINTLNKYKSYTEKELFELIAEGDETAFNEFYFRVLPNATSYLLRMLKSKDAVKEVLQETLVRFWLHRDKLVEIEQPRAWLFRILINECYRCLHLQAEQQAKLESLDPDYYSANITALYQTDKDLSYRETQRIISAAVAKLSPRQREVFKMSREEGLTLPEIAAKLGLDRDYIKKVLMLALHNIRQQLVAAGRWLPLLLWWGGGAKYFF